MVMGRSDHKKIPRHLCECGCGQEVKKNRSRFIQGHYSKFLVGNKNSFYGKKHKEFAKQCMRIGINRKKTIGDVKHENSANIT